MKRKIETAAENISRLDKCSECGGSGWLTADMRDGIGYLERCDSCGRYPNDIEAARAFFHAGVWHNGRRFVLLGVAIQAIEPPASEIEKLKAEIAKLKADRDGLRAACEHVLGDWERNLTDAVRHVADAVAKAKGQA